MADTRVRSLTNSEKRVREILLALQEIGAIPGEPEASIDLGRIVVLSTRDGSTGSVAKDQVRERRGIHVAGGQWNVWVTLRSDIYAPDGAIEAEPISGNGWRVTYLKVEVWDRRVYSRPVTFDSHDEESITFLLALSKSFVMSLTN